MKNDFALTMTSHGYILGTHMNKCTLLNNVMCVYNLSFNTIDIGTRELRDSFMAGIRWSTSCKLPHPPCESKIKLVGGPTTSYNTTGVLTWTSSTSKNYYFGVSGCCVSNKIVGRIICKGWWRGKKMSSSSTPKVFETDRWGTTVVVVWKHLANHVLTCHN